MLIKFFGNSWGSTDQGEPSSVLIDDAVTWEESWPPEKGFDAPPCRPLLSKCYGVLAALQLPRPH